ncbi:motility associated factor glycosyltransferase family protein [Paenibacillus planticolens]|uniref:DUF115 domain-containing protein n=1 Tax=Paenibacillus planticolens TaxID=2654976 RepID=A0ABX1ZNX4_9BACL|nr:6-hydroxymethylpterin diphosphokinase MptE-like protein [Paenibacillus planticolens]NOV00469.1 DUF115 domain-containing protein [Paenibacillus planticolens]
MIIADNVMALREKFPAVLAVLKALEPHENSFKSEVTMSKNNLPTLAMLSIEERKQYIHSQYDPRKEAENIISKYEDEVSNYDHVFFYGIGLGYHVEAFLNKYKDVPVTLYEPNLTFAYQWLSHRSLKGWNFKQIQNIILQTNEDNISYYIGEFLKSLTGEVLIITLPSYDRYFENQTTTFMNKFTEVVTNFRGTINANHAFEKLWVLNSANNFKFVLNSPNIFEYSEVFNSKPVIIVSAGPSLEEEILHLKEIAKHRQAFIFAVGSANKVLLSHNIIPDALCTYDPNPHNKLVYQEIVEKKIDSIPLIFGSSVYYEVLTQYPGPKVHAITSQDSVSRHYLQKESIFKEEKFVTDAPSIAVVTLEILLKLGCSPIILVGQNLAIRNNQFYSKGIEYKLRSTEVSEAEQADYIWVRSVNGENIPTMRNLNMMRLHMEMLISTYKNKSIINTTQGGAHIEGTTFMALYEVMKNIENNTIGLEHWYTSRKTTYNQSEISRFIREMEKELLLVKRMFQDAVDILKRFDSLIKSNNSPLINQLFPKWDKLINKIINNDYYKVYVQPMNRVQFDMLLKASPEIKQCNDPIKKARLLLDVFGKYIYECLTHMDYCELFSKEVAKVKNSGV